MPDQPSFTSIIARQGEPIVARFRITAAISAVGRQWEEIFPGCLAERTWRWSIASVDRLGYVDSFAEIRRGDPGILLHGFHWRDPDHPPRNKTGSRRGPRAPYEIFREQAVFSEYVLFEAADDPYQEPDETPDQPIDWGIRLPFKVIAHHRRPLAMTEINPSIVEALHRSTHNISTPSSLPPTTIGTPLTDDASTSAWYPRTLFAGLAATKELTMPISMLLTEDTQKRISCWSAVPARDAALHGLFFLPYPPTRNEAAPHPFFTLFRPLGVRAAWWRSSGRCWC